MELQRPPLHLFEGFGIELEYMIVDASLCVLPVCDRVLAAAAGETVNEVEDGALCWSNELVMHVIELKTNGPAPMLLDLDGLFLEGVARVNERLAPFGGRLLPTAMHPLMDPSRQTRLWPHGNRDIYNAYDRIFRCRGHGWSNLQSMHINLPFAGDEEFARLHAAIRLLLPLLPGLCASSPLMEGRATGLLDTRLDVYRRNQRRIPSIAGQLVPEAALSHADYLEKILAPMYRDIAPFDPQGILQEEWLNSRGAIARFERNAIEIRVIDIQECPAADIAVATLVVAVLRALTEGRWGDPALHRDWPLAPLVRLFDEAVRDADRTLVEDGDYLRLFGYPKAKATLKEFWNHLAQEAAPQLSAPCGRALSVLLEEGPLSRRILRALGPEPGRREILALYRQLGDRLAEGRVFCP